MDIYGTNCEKTMKMIGFQGATGESQSIELPKVR